MQIMLFPKFAVCLSSRFEVPEQLAPLMPAGVRLKIKPASRHNQRPTPPFSTVKSISAPVILPPRARRFRCQEIGRALPRYKNGLYRNMGPFPRVLQGSLHCLAAKVLDRPIPASRLSVHVVLAFRRSSHFCTAGILTRLNIEWRCLQDSCGASSNAHHAACNALDVADLISNSYFAYRYYTCALIPV